MADYKIYEVSARARFTDATELDPKLVSTAAAVTGAFEKLVINGVEYPASALAAGEVNAILAAIQQAVVDKLDFTIGVPTQVPHGDGTFVIDATVDTAPTEDWTVQFLTPTTYTVVGSVTGALANGDTTAGAPAGAYEAVGYFDATATVGAIPFMTGDRFRWTITHTPAAAAAAVANGGNTGDGTVTLQTAVDGTAVTEVWTIAFTSATEYTVTGSVTGPLATGDLSVAAGVYNNAHIGFTVTAGATPFINGDSFTIATTAGSSVSGAVTHDPIGNGTVVVNSYNGITAVVETWTITFLTATTYSVTGSVTGASTPGNMAVAAGVYDNGIFNMTVTAGATPFVPGDKWTIAFAL